MNKNLETDWSVYHKAQNIGSKIAPITRKHTKNVLLSLLKKYLNTNNSNLIAELGGGSSAFFDDFYEELTPSQYYLIDYCEEGLKNISNKKYGNNSNVKTLQKDLLNDSVEEYFDKFDLVYSVGLIEHFRREDTQKMIQVHFELLKPGGFCLITFPTPTWLYQVSRFALETANQWIFFDERPLEFSEVTESCNKYGKLLDSKTNWPIILTQGVVVYQKKEDEVL